MRPTKFWTDCADAQADLSLRWAHISEGTFSHVGLLFILLLKDITKKKTSPCQLRLYTKGIRKKKLEVTYTCIWSLIPIVIQAANYHYFTICILCSIANVILLGFCWDFFFKLLVNTWNLPGSSAFKIFKTRNGMLGYVSCNIRFRLFEDRYRSCTRSRQV